MGTAGRRWLLGLRFRTLVWLVLLATVALSLYSYWADYTERTARRERELLSPAAGDFCKVVLRGDALGMEQMPAVASQIEGVKNFVEGRFVTMNDQWLKLDGAAAGDPQQWIPRANVLVIEVAPP